MSTYVLLHGAWHGAWCWKDVSEFLTASGHTVITPEIPWTYNAGRKQPVNFDGIVDDLCDLIVSLKTQVTLVGHSFAGMLNTMIASKIPDHILSIYFISGFIPENGQTLNDLEPLMSGSVVSPNLHLDKKKRTVTVPDEFLRQGFYHDCSEQEYLFAKTRVQPQLAFTFFSPVKFNSEKINVIKKYYIECLEDKAVPLTAQRAMQNNLSFDGIVALPCSHSPFISMPEELAKSLFNP